MPQGRRKVPFSAKQKKAQLQQKRDKKRNTDFKAVATVSSQLPRDHSDDNDDDDEDNEDDDDDASEQEERQEGKSSRLDNKKPSSKFVGVKKSLNEQPIRSRNKAAQNFDPNRYRLQFHRESKEEVARRRLEAALPIEPSTEESLEIDLDDVFLPGSQLDMPKRPRWDYGMSKEHVDARENRYFREYLMAVEANFSMEKLSFFELNLETWRQLWRVLEMSDVVFIVVDIRFPALLVSPALYEHVAIDLKKDVVIVLNKIDLAPPSLVVAWKHHLLKRFPLVRVACFTSFPSADSASEKDPAKSVHKQLRRGGRLRMAAEGASRILQICESVVGDKGKLIVVSKQTGFQVDLRSWKRKIIEELKEVSEDYDEPVETTVTVEKFDTGFEEYERFKNRTLTIGFIGQPNVGKSSLINALVGKKVVSVSRTPGHTKHFQTIFLTDNVRLCDCPGLVFPSNVPKGLQVLAGSYPIAQLQEPYSSVRFVAEHIALPKLLKLRHPEEEGACALGASALPWSPLDICDAWAERRGFKTARAARNDTYRAANHLLRMALESRLCLCLRPKGYTRDRDKWETHVEVDEVCKIVARKRELMVEAEAENHSLSDVYDDDDGDVERQLQESDSSSDEDESPSSVNKFALLAAE